MPTKIFVGSLPDGTSADDIRALFEAHGTVQECDVIKDYGFVHMTQESDAHAAIQALNGHEFKGVAITVEESRSKVRVKPGMGGSSTCFRCGKTGHWSKECRLAGGGGGSSRGPRGYGPPPRGHRPGPYDRPSSFDRRPAYDPYERKSYDRYDYREVDYYARRSPPPRDYGYSKESYATPAYRDPYERPYTDPYERPYSDSYAPAASRYGPSPSRAYY